MSYRSRRVKEIRTSLGLSQAALADELKLTRGTITRWESGDVTILDSNLNYLETYKALIVLRLRVDRLRTILPTTIAEIVPDDAVAELDKP